MTQKGRQASKTNVIIPKTQQHIWPLVNNTIKNPTHTHSYSTIFSPSKAFYLINVRRLTIVGTNKMRKYTMSYLIM